MNKNSILFKRILNNKFLFKYIIKIGRIPRSLNLKYFQAVDARWLLTNGYESLIWYKLSQFGEQLVWLNLSSSSAIGVAIIKHGSWKLFQKFFYEPNEREIMFPSVNRKLYIQTAILSRNHEVLKAIIDHDPTIDQLFYIRLCLESSNADVMRYLLKKLNLNNIDHLHQELFNDTMINSCAGICSSGYNSYTSSPITPIECEQFILMLEELNLFRKVKYLTTLMLSGNHALITRICDTYPLEYDFDHQVSQYISMVFLRITVNIPFKDAVETVRFVLDREQTVARRYVKFGEETISKFTKLTDDEKMKVLLYEVIVQFPVDESRPNNTLRELSNLTKSLIAINDCEDPDIKFSKYLVKTLDMRTVAAYSKSISRLRQVKPHILQPHSMLQLQYYIESNTESDNSQQIYNLWKFKHNTRETITYISRNFTNILAKFKDHPEFFSSFILNNIDCIEYQTLLYFLPSGGVPLDTKTIKELKFYSVEDAKMVCLVVGKLNFEEIPYLPIQDTDYEIVEYYLSQISDQEKLLQRLNSILEYSLEKKLRNIIELIIEKNEQLFVPLQRYIDKKSKHRVFQQEGEEVPRNILVSKFYGNMIQSAKEDSIIQLIVESIFISKGIEVIGHILNQITSIALINRVIKLFSQKHPVIQIDLVKQTLSVSTSSKVMTLLLDFYFQKSWTPSEAATFIPKDNQLLITTFLKYVKKFHKSDDTYREFEKELLQIK